jgi:hypothetical protein
MQSIRRGGFAQDKRTGQYVRVAEDGREAGWMVRPVYKSDGYWVQAEDLEPASDPHPWSRRDLVKLLLIVVAMLWTGSGAVYTVHHAGLDWVHALAYGVSSGLVTGSVLSLLSGLYRP